LSLPVVSWDELVPSHPWRRKLKMRQGWAR
jgi:hypothetical protein